MGAVAHKHHGAQPSGAQQSRGLARILKGVARNRVHQYRGLGYPMSDRGALHQFRFRYWPAATTRKDQERRSSRVEKLDADLQPPPQRRRTTAAEDDDGVGSSTSLRNVNSRMSLVKALPLMGEGW